MIDRLLSSLREFADEFAPSPETRARREATALHLACCSLLMEVLRLDTTDSAEKRRRVVEVMQAQFDLPETDLGAMIEHAGRPENRPTSYYDAVALINRNFEPARKAQFVEQLWRVAMVDGGIDIYEDHLVRKLADLMYVSHNDFILAKNRVQAQAG